jgi:hypothetical protein
MKDLNIPIPNFSEKNKAEIILKVRNGKLFQYYYRIESFIWENDDEFSNEADEISRSLARISRLKKAILDYDKEWELIQIYTPSKDSRTIQVLYRKKTQ